MVLLHKVTFGYKSLVNFQMHASLTHMIIPSEHISHGRSAHVKVCTNTHEVAAYKGSKNTFGISTYVLESKNTIFRKF